MELLTVLCALFVIAVLLFRKTNLGIAMVAGAVILGILYRLPAPKWWKVLLDTFTSVGNLQILAAFYLIMALENVLRANGMLDRLMNACRALIPDARVVMALLPAFMGFLPSMGGALFSAPLVNQAASGHELSAERKFMINYWFRHVWEYFLPIYPAVLLATAMLGFSTRSFVVHFYGFSILAIVLGFWVCFRGVKALGSGTVVNEPRANMAYARDLAFTLSPVLIILVLVIVVRMEIAWATALVLFTLLVYYRYAPAGLLAVAKEAFHGKIIGQVIGILLFKEMLLQSGAVVGVVGFLQSAGISPLALTAVMTLALGMLTGTPQAVIGMVFPIISGYPPESHLPLAMVGFVCGIAGQMISPMHLCLVVTQEYFQSHFSKVLPLLIVMESVIVLAALTAYHLWQA